MPRSPAAHRSPQQTWDPTEGHGAASTGNEKPQQSTGVLSGCSQCQTCRRSHAELPATSFSFPNFLTSSGTSLTHRQHIRSTGAVRTHSLSWRPRPVQKRCLETGGLVHRALEPSRGGTHGLPPDTNPRISLKRPGCSRRHDHARERQSANTSVFFQSPRRSCTRVVRGGLSLFEELTHLEARSRAM